MKKITSALAILFSLFTSVATSQSTKTSPILKKIDSLENMAIKQSQSSADLFKTLCQIEELRFDYDLNITNRSNVSKLDSLSKILNTKEAQLKAAILRLQSSITETADKNKKIKSVIELLEIAKQIKDTTSQLQLLYNAAYLNLAGYRQDGDSIRNLSKYFAQNYYKQIELLANKTGKPADMCWWYKASIDYYDMIEKDYAKFFDAASKGLQLSYKNLECNKLIRYFLVAQSQGYMFAGKFDEAKKCIDKCVQMPEIESSNAYAKLMASYGNLFLRNDKLDSGVYYLEKALAYNNSLSKPNTLLTEGANSYLVTCYSKLKNYQQALSHYYSYDSIHDIRIEEEKQTELNEVQSKYAIEKKEAEKMQLEKQKKMLSIAIAVAIALLLLITMLFVIMYKQNKKLKQLAYFRDKIHSIISHDLRSPLYALQSLYEQASFCIKKNNIQQLQQISDSIDQSSIKMSNLLNNLLLWSNENVFNKNNYLTPFNLYQSIQNTVGLYANICSSKDIVIKNLIASDTNIKTNKNVVELIVRNWIDNTLKYSNATLVEITAQQQQNITTVSIVDNGNIPTKILAQIQQQITSKDVDTSATNASGLGLSLINYFANKEGWKINLATTNQQNVFTIVIS